jgi:hypothetical protein
MRGYEIIESIIADNYPVSVNKRVWYLGQAISLLSGADAVYFIDGWKDSLGCQIEWQVASSYGIKILND